MTAKIVTGTAPWSQPQKVEPQLAVAKGPCQLASEAFLEEAVEHTSPIVIAASCMFKTTGGGQRPAQQAKAFAAQPRPVVYANEGEWLHPEGNILFSGRVGYEIVVNFLRDATGVVIYGLDTLRGAAERFGDGWLKVFDLMDDWEAYDGMGHRVVFDREEYLKAIRTADLVTCSARRLMEIAKEHGAKARTLIRNAGPKEPFVQEDDPPDFLQGTPAVVFLGCVWGKWLDWNVMQWLARDLHKIGGVINIVGGLNDGYMSNELPNVRWHKEKPWAEAMKYVAASDIGIVPFTDDPVTHSVDPIKYYDYVAGGCRVVATHPLWELEGRDHCQLAPRQRLFEAVIEQAEKPELTMTQMKEFCIRNSWAARCAAMDRAFGREPPDDYWDPEYLSSSPFDTEVAE